MGPGIGITHIKYALFWFIYLFTFTSVKTSWSKRYYYRSMLVLRKLFKRDHAFVELKNQIDERIYCLFKQKQSVIMWCQSTTFCHLHVFISHLLHRVHTFDAWQWSKQMYKTETGEIKYFSVFRSSFSFFFFYCDSVSSSKHNSTNKYIQFIQYMYLCTQYISDAIRVYEVQYYIHNIYLTASLPIIFGFRLCLF